MEADFTDYGIPLAPFTSFVYLWIFFLDDDNDCPAVVRNLQKERREWASLTRVLSREGSYARTSGQIYMAVVQSVLLYRSDMWVNMPRIGRVLGIFHHRVARRLTGSQPQRGRDGVWIYTPLEDVMAEA